jgi:hypothetical protein
MAMGGITDSYGHGYGLFQSGGLARKVFRMHSSAMVDFEIDAIEEIRLRTWARENYVPSSERDENWHPVILEEMSRKDREQEEIA